MPKARSTVQKAKSMLPYSTSGHLSRSNMVNDTSRYSGSDPQILPFPHELVVRILNYLDQAYDKRSARMVCKGFAAAGLPSLTSTIYFSTSLIRRSYPSNVLHISSPTLEMAMHPVVSKYITSLVCDGALFTTSDLEFTTFQGWWTARGRYPTSWTMEDIHKIYKSRSSLERWMIDRGDDQKILCTALKHCLNLKSVFFTDVAPDEHLRTFPRPSWPSVFPGGDLWGAYSPYHSFATCIRWLSEMAIKLHELHIKGKNPIFHSIFSPTSTTDYNHLLNVFANLCRISINVNPHRGSPLGYAGLGRLLTNATLLQSLDLNSTPMRIRQSHLDLSEFFRGFTWPHLKHFRLAGFAMHTDAGLIDFFHRHRATVDSVTLMSMFLHEKHVDHMDDPPCEAWKHFFGELRKRSIKFQNLKLFLIHDCCHTELRFPQILHTRARGGERVLEYLRDGGPNPLAFDTVDGRQ